MSRMVVLYWINLVSCTSIVAWKDSVVIDMIVGMISIALGIIVLMADPNPVGLPSTWNGPGETAG
jgi:hypothetical protein